MPRTSWPRRDHASALLCIMPQTFTHLIVGFRSEETAEDVRARIYAIQENEIDQQRELTNFLDLELNFAEQYVEVLHDVKMNWVDE